MSSLQEYSEYDAALLLSLSTDERTRLAHDALNRLLELKKDCQLYFYEPANPGARAIHLSTAREILATGGNRSTKSDTMLAEAVIQMTGFVPKSLESEYPRSKIHPPIRVRLVCTSLTNTWDAVLKPKLQYWQWSGRGLPYEGLGHWGWIPKSFLINGKWDDSWHERLRRLTLTNGSTLQVMSYDQAVADFGGGSFDLVLHDEGPPHSIYRENKMRTIDTSGRLMIAMTPPDDESASWDAAWVYDELYEKGLPGDNKDPQIDSFTLFTEDNRILAAKDIHAICKGLTPQQREVRLKGRFLHLSGRIYPQYTDRPQTWCFACDNVCLEAAGKCASCGRNQIVSYCHFISPLDYAYKWPCVYLLDPHPRKPHAMVWIAVDPADNWWVLAEKEIDAEPTIVAKEVEELEREQKLSVRRRLIDPNMGRSPSGPKRGVTVQQEFADAGLICDLADDNRDTARSRVREMLKPDYRAREPRLRVFHTAPKCNYQMMRYCWDEWHRYSSHDRDPKPVPREKWDDFPTLLGYLANYSPTYRSLTDFGRSYKYTYTH